MFSYLRIVRRRSYRTRNAGARGNYDLRMLQKMRPNIGPVRAV
jgi:hypothetical protein